MFKRNCGRFTEKITFQKPEKPKRDELGGLLPTSYINIGSVFAMCETRSQSRQNVMGDYVTVDTRYFVMRDISSLYPDMNTEWRLHYKGFTYRINQIERITESRPYYMQITATAINTGGGII